MNQRWLGVAASCGLVACAVASSANDAYGDRLRSARPIISNKNIELKLEAHASGIAIVGIGIPGRSAAWKAASSAQVDLHWIDHCIVAGKSLVLRWKLDHTSRISPAEVSMAYSAIGVSLSLTSTWKATHNGPVEHTISIINRSHDTVELPIQRTLLLHLESPSPHMLHTWVEKSAGGPSDAGTHHSPISKGYSVTLRSTPYSEDKPHDAIPWTSVDTADGSAGLYAGVEFSGCVDLTVSSPDAAHVVISAGQTSEARDLTRLLPGERYLPPVAFIGAHHGGVDSGSNQLKQWLRAHVCAVVQDPMYPLLTLNSWGSGMAIDEAMAHSMSANAAKLGLEMFHIDAGWFQTVGDWRSNIAKFPNGLKPVSQSIKAVGLRFGLWTGWTQGGLGDDLPDPRMTLNVFNPDRRNWFAHPPKPDWKPEDFVGSDICLADAAAREWSVTMLDRLVTQLGIDMLEHDQRMVVSQCQQTSHSHTSSPTDIAYRAAQGYYDVYDQIRKKHPHLMFEDCVNGGRMVDFGVIKRVSYISISDTYTPLPNRQAFFDNSFAIPPAMCECYVSDRELPKSDAEFLTMLRSGMMGWFTLMQDPATWSPHRFELAQAEFERYKALLRPLVRSGDLYHSLPRPKQGQWDGVQYCATDGTKSAVFAFRSGSQYSQKVFPIKGLTGRWTYRIRFSDGKLEDLQSTGEALMRDGLKVNVANKDGSEIIEIAVIRRGKNTGSNLPASRN